MLLVSAFTFFGLSALQNLSYFTDFLGDVKITVNISTQEEEESETKTSNEVKELKNKNSNYQSKLALFCLNSLAFKVYSLKHSTAFLEVVTPPPKLIVS